MKTFIANLKSIPKKINIINIMVYTTVIVIAVAYAQWFFKSVPIEYLQRAACNLTIIMFCAMLVRMIPAIKQYFKPETLPEAVTPSRKELASVFVKSAIWILLLNAVMAVAIAYRRPGVSVGEALTQDFAYYLDTSSYIRIAESWYRIVNEDSQYQIVFFPLYAIMLRLFNFIGNYTVTGIILSSVCAVLSGVAMYLLAQLDMKQDAAYRSVKYMYILPSAFFIIMPLTEGTFLLLCLLYIYFVRRSKWLPTLITGIAAGLVRSHGLLLLIIGGMELLGELRSVWGKKGALYALRAFFAVMGPALGFGMYLFINYTMYNNPLHFLSVQGEHWHNGLGFFWKTPDYLIYYASDWYRNWREAFYATSVPQLVMLFLTLTLFVAGAKRLRLSYSAYCIAYFIISYGQTWLISGPRYISCLFPLSMIAALITQKKGIDRMLSLLYILLFIAYYFMFLRKWPIF